MTEETLRKCEAGRVLFDQGSSITKIKKELHVNDMVLSNYLKSKGYKILGNKEHKELREEAAKLYLSGFGSVRQVADKLGLCRTNLYGWFRKMGITVINEQNLHKFDENIFDSIDTEEKAYWLGFIFADGYICSNDIGKKRKYTFELSLQLADKDHLQKFSDFMQYEYGIKLDSFRCRFSLNSKHFWNILNSYGCTPRKSLTLKFPDESIFKDKVLIKDFIRGYIDGDGCLSWCNKEHTNPHLSVLGTKDFIDNIQNYLLENKVITKIYSTYNEHPDKNTFVLAYTGTVAIIIANFLYKDSKIKLDRKYDKYNEYLVCKLALKIKNVIGN